MDQIACLKDEEPPFASALRALVHSFGDLGSDNDCESILMDTDLDGCRYLLIRMPAVIRKTAPLSPREIEIVRLIAAGHPNKVIAVVLEISVWTVCTHLRRIFAKLGVNSRAAMIARITEFGLVPRAAEPADIQRVLKKLSEKQVALF
jgi:DNA-binding CsgD family transcriptional regulator